MTSLPRDPRRCRRGRSRRRDGRGDPDHGRYPRGGRARDPRELESEALTRFLSGLAVEAGVSASTQNQALAALIFLYRETLGLDFPWLDDLVRAKRRKRLPVVMTREEVRAVLDRLDGAPRLLACLLYGSGLRLLEACRLRVKDVELGRKLLVVRCGKGDKDRLTVLPRFVQPDLCEHLERARRQHEVDSEAEPASSSCRQASRVLSNVLLDEWDKELERRGHRFVRYADDCNIYVRSRRAGERVLASCRRFLERRLRLAVNEEKSAVARPSTRTFLGYSMTGHRVPKLRLGADTLRRLKDRLRMILRRNRGRSMATIVFELNQHLRGWLGYFRLIETPSVLKKLQSWIQRKLRCYRIKQLRRASQLFWELKRLGQPAGELAWLLSTSRRPWRLSRNPHVHEGFGPRYFTSLGLFHLPTAWRTLGSAT